MFRKDYDYVVEMMKEYHPDDGIKKPCVINYDAIAEQLCIVTRSEKKPVSSEVKEKFREAYERYVIRRLSEIKEPLAIIMFQGTYNPIIPRNQPRKGMVYIEDNLRQVLRNLPKLPKGEKYAFPALKIIRSEDGSDAFIFSR